MKPSTSAHTRPCPGLDDEGRRLRDPDTAEPHGRVHDPARVVGRDRPVRGEGDPAAGGQDVGVAPRLAPDPHAGIATVARSYRRAFAAHPNAVGLIGGRSVRTTMALNHYDDMLAALLRAGRPADDAMRILLAIDYLALGAALAPSPPASAISPARRAARTTTRTSARHWPPSTRRPSTTRRSNGFWPPSSTP